MSPRLFWKFSSFLKFVNLDKTSKTWFINFVGIQFFRIDVLKIYKSCVNLFVSAVSFSLWFSAANLNNCRFFIKNFEVKCWGWFEFFMKIEEDRFFGRIVCILIRRQLHCNIVWSLCRYFTNSHFLPYRYRDSVPLHVHLQFNFVERFLFHFVLWIFQHFFLYFRFIARNVLDLEPTQTLFAEPARQRKWED